MDERVKEILHKQLELLAEYSKESAKGCENGILLVQISLAMCEIVKLNNSLSGERIEFTPEDSRRKYSIYTPSVPCP